MRTTNWEESHSEADREKLAVYLTHIVRHAVIDAACNSMKLTSPKLLIGRASLSIFAIAIRALLFHRLIEGVPDLS